MVPEGWRLSTMGEHVDLLTGFPFKSDRYTSEENDVRLLRGDNIGQGRIRWRDAKRWPADECQALSRYELREGDFVVAMDRTWITGGLKVAEVRYEDTPCLLVQRVARLRAKPSLDPRLLKHHFGGHRFEQYVKGVQTETAVPHISPADIRDYPLPLPPLDEQRRMAEILSTWDGAIETTEKLAANADKQRRALIQQLLDAPHWPLRRLSDLGSIRSAGVDKKSVEGQQRVRLLNYLDVMRRDFIYSTELDHWVTASEQQIASCGLRKGDVFFTPSSETRDDIGHSAVVMEDIQDAAYSYHVVRFRPIVALDLKFRAYMFKSRHFYKQCCEWCEGSGQRYVIAQDYFRGFTIGVPPLAEQVKIGALFFDLDRRLAVYSQELLKLQSEKRALMQQLLTGKRRVTV
jgi:type I restriction enzyme S subunit